MQHNHRNVGSTLISAASRTFATVLVITPLHPPCLFHRWAWTLPGQRRSRWCVFAPTRSKWVALLWSSARKQCFLRGLQLFFFVAAPAADGAPFLSGTVAANGTLAEKRVHGPLLMFMTCPSEPAGTSDSVFVFSSSPFFFFFFKPPTTEFYH